MSFFQGGRGFLASNSGGGGGTDFSAGGTMNGNLTVNGSITFTGQALGPSGTNAAPTYSFSALPNAGMLSSAGVAFSVGGAGKLTVNTTVVVPGSLDVQQAMAISGEAVKVTNYTAIATDAVVVMNATSLTLTLPGTPATDQILWVRNNDATTLSVARNGNNINGAAADLTVLAGTAVVLAFFSGTGWWVVG